jgi:hypothetical protein
MTGYGGANRLARADSWVADQAGSRCRSACCEDRRRAQAGSLEPAKLTDALALAALALRLLLDEQADPRAGCRTNGLEGPNSAGVVLEQVAAAAHDPEISARAADFIVVHPS